VILGHVQILLPGAPLLMELRQEGSNETDCGVFVGEDPDGPVPFVKTIEGFDFDSQPSLDPKRIRKLATSRWVANGENVALLGPPGVGKPHLAVALGRWGSFWGLLRIYAHFCHLSPRLSE
jgi:hypothetical protein